MFSPLRNQNRAGIKLKKLSQNFTNAIMCYYSKFCAFITLQLSDSKNNIPPIRLTVILAV